MMKVENVKADIDAAIQSDDNSNEAQRSVQDKLVDMALQKCTLFANSEERAFVTYNSSPSVQEHWPVLSNEFRRTLGQWYYDAYKKAPKKEYLSEACESLAGRAFYEGETHEVYLRVAVQDDKWYIDLCNPAWQVVEISTSGWCVLDRSPVRFVRSKNMTALPLPKTGGSIDELWTFINIPDKSRLLVLGWIAESLRQNTQKPVLELLGGKGTGKSHATEILRSLVDPSTAPLRNFPGSDEALFVSSQFNWVMTYENQSHLTDRQQDLLCQVSTGSAYVKRTSHTDADETVLQALRPQIINGITPMATRMDLIDRCISVELNTLSNNLRKSKNALVQKYTEAHPRILGALFQVIADALKELPNIQLKAPPRLVDFGMMGEAVGRVIGCQQSFCDLIRQNKKGMSMMSLEASPVCMALMKFCENNQSDHIYSGNYAGLLSRLEQYRPYGSRGWVDSAKGLAGVLKRNASGFADIGIHLTFPAPDERRNTGYRIDIRREHCDTSTLTTRSTPTNAIKSVLGELSVGADEDVSPDERSETLI